MYFFCAAAMYMHADERWKPFCVFLCDKEIFCVRGKGEWDEEHQFFLGNSKGVRKNCFKVKIQNLFFNIVGRRVIGCIAFKTMIISHFTGCESLKNCVSKCVLNVDSSSSKRQKNSKKTSVPTSPGPCNPIKYETEVFRGKICRMWEN